MLRWAAALLPALLSSASAKQPHLVMMVLDDVGWSDVGYQGSDFSTPNIDTLATKQGVRLGRYYVQQVCSPTRSALLTGRYPFRIGMQHMTTLMPASPAGIPRDTPTIAEVLKQAGYSTHAIGKWHCGMASWSQTPVGRGFDSFLGYLNGQVDYYNQTIGGGFDFWQNESVFWEARGTYTMDHYMQEAQRILDGRDASKPMFLYFAHQQIHIPLQAPPGAKAEAACAHMKKTAPDGENRHVACTMMSALDTAIGDFVAMLKSKGMWEDTVLWVTTDNGGMTQWQPAWPASASSNYPLRAGKTTLFEGGVRGVSFVTGGFVPTKALGTVRTGLMQHVDITRTFVTLAGADLNPSDGFDIWSSITSGAPSPRSEAVLNVDRSLLARRNFSAIIAGDMKLINGHATSTKMNADGWWTNDPYTFIEANDTASQPVKLGGVDVWLFNVSADEGEHRNMAADRPDIVFSLQARLAELASKSDGYRGPQLNFPNPRGYYKLHGGVWKPYKRFSEEESESDADEDESVLLV